MPLSSEVKVADQLSVELGRVQPPKEKTETPLEKPSKSPTPKSLEASNQSSNRIRDD